MGIRFTEEEYAAFQQRQRISQCAVPDLNEKQKQNKEERQALEASALEAKQMKILAGYDDNTFRHKGHCLRRQMVTFLYKYDKYINGKG